MRTEFADQFARRFIRLVAYAQGEPCNPILSPSRDFNEEARTEQLAKDRQKVGPAMSRYLSALLTHRNDNPAQEDAEILDVFYAKYVDRNQRDFFRRSLSV